MSRVTADSLIQSLQETNPDLYNILYTMNKDLQDTRAVADKTSSIIKMATSQSPGISTNAQAIIYYDPVTLQLMVSQNGSPYDYLALGASCAMLSNTAQTIGGTQTVVTWAAGDIVFDPHTLFDTANSRIVFNAPGVWLIGGGLVFDVPGPVTTYYVDITVAGIIAAEVTEQSTNPALGAALFAATIWKVKAGDVAQLRGEQTSGAGVNAVRKHLWALRLGGGVF